LTANPSRYITRITEDIHEPSIECELATLCLQYLTFPCFEIEEGEDENEFREFMLNGHFAFQDYAIAKWFHHVNAFVNNGRRFLDEAVDSDGQLSALSGALDDFIDRFEEVDWTTGLVQNCASTCSAFQDYVLHENLLLLASHIYTFQQKGFEARHKISIKSLNDALERNRKLLEDTKTLSKTEMSTYSRFYDDKRRFKCTKITCRYFSQGFADVKAKKRHINIHDRPYQCEVSECLGAEGFANEKDLKNHTRSFHPELSDLAETFNSSITKRAKADYACIFCGKTFTRKFHCKNHEKAHRGEREHECPECGRAFTRMNDMKRHSKLHERGR
jgi:DNA-directed RNA polymerase subunit RPC12/RpoP